jgi:hypothetical protein
MFSFSSFTVLAYLEDRLSSSRRDANIHEIATLPTNTHLCTYVAMFSTGRTIKRRVIRNNN